MYAKTLVVVVAALGLSACDLEQAQATWGGLTNPLVAQGLVIGVEAPSSDQVDLSGTGFEEGTTATVFLADARSVDDLEQAPVGGANVTLGGVAFSEVTAGSYALDPTAGFTYNAGGTGRLVMDLDGDTASATVPMPAPIDVNVPSDHSANTALTLNMAGKPYHAALVVVIDAQTGAVEWTNKPDTIRGVYDMTRGDAVADVEIPAATFGQSVYAVGVAGLKHTTSDQLDGMNTAISSVLAGKMQFHIVNTIPTR